MREERKREREKEIDELGEATVRDSADIILVVARLLRGLLSCEVVECSPLFA